MLSKPDLLLEIERGNLRFTPPIDITKQVDQISINLRLGPRFSRFKPPLSDIKPVRVDPSIFSSLDIWEDTEAESYVIRPTEFVLAQTLERVTLPNDLGGLVEGRSSYARFGIGVHVTAPKIDPGFSGTITLEFANHGVLPIELVVGTMPAQLMLFRLSTPLKAEELYGTGSADIFQHQDRPIPRRES